MVPRAVVFAMALALGVLGAPAAAAQDSAPTPEKTPAQPAAPAPQGSRRIGNVVIEFDRGSVDESGNQLLEGAVTIRADEGELRMQAHRIVWKDDRFVEAEGNVLVVWGGNRIAGTAMRYDIKEDHGYVENAVGVVEPQTGAALYFTAERAQKVGEDLVLLDRAVVTTCTQPVPYWSFSVSHAKVQLDHYAHLQNVLLRAGRVPVFYLPYLLWPVKPDRSAGLLFPEFGSTRDRGQVFSMALFVPLGRSADVRVAGAHYTKAGTGGSVRFRWIPNERGVTRFEGFYINDQIYGGPRHRASYQQVQTFTNGLRLVADLNEVSDFQFLTDYEREIALASSPQVQARLEVVRNGPWTSVNVRELRRERSSGDATRVQETLPEIEMRGRSRRLGHTPLYLSFESSAVNVEQFGDGPDFEYYRGDLFPTLSAPWSPMPWLDISPSISWRGTYYTQSRIPNTSITVDEALSRSLFRGGVELVGPKLYRIYGGQPQSGRARYKNVIEPRLGYEYRTSDIDQERILPFDEVDTITTASNQIFYGVRSKLFARRPRAELKDRDAVARPVTMDLELTGGSLNDVDPGAAAAQAETAKEQAERAEQPQEPVEILSLEFRQNRSMNTNLRSEDLDGDGVLDPGEDTDQNGQLDRSRYSTLEMIGPTPVPRPAWTCAGAGPLFDQLSELSVSGNLSPRPPAFSIVRRAGVGQRHAHAVPGGGRISPVERQGALGR
jgi:LPS-assembly protein